MPKLRKFNAARLSGRRLLEYLVRFEIHEPEPHGPMTPDPFEVTAPAHSSANERCLSGASDRGRVTRSR